MRCDENRPQVHFFKKISGIVDAVEDYEADSETHDGEDQINA